MHFVPAVTLCLIFQTYQSDDKDEKRQMWMWRLLQGNPLEFSYNY